MSDMNWRASWRAILQNAFQLSVIAIAVLLMLAYCFPPAHPLH